MHYTYKLYGSNNYKNKLPLCIANFKPARRQWKMLQQMVAPTCCRWISLEPLVSIALTTIVSTTVVCIAAVWTQQCVVHKLIWLIWIVKVNYIITLLIILVSWAFNLMCLIRCIAWLMLVIIIFCNDFFYGFCKPQTENSTDHCTVNMYVTSVTNRKKYWKGIF